MSDGKKHDDQAKRLEEEDKRTKQEKSEGVDEALDETFPASDPAVSPSITGRD